MVKEYCFTICKIIDLEKFETREICGTIISKREFKKYLARNNNDYKEAYSELLIERFPNGLKEPKDFLDESKYIVTMQNNDMRWTDDPFEFFCKVIFIVLIILVTFVFVCVIALFFVDFFENLNNYINFF